MLTAGAMNILPGSHGLTKDEIQKACHLVVRLATHGSLAETSAGGQVTIPARDNSQETGARLIFSNRSDYFPHTHYRARLSGKSCICILLWISQRGDCCQGHGHLC